MPSRRSCRAIAIRPRRSGSATWPSATSARETGMRAHASSTIFAPAYVSTLRSESCASRPPVGAAIEDALIHATGLP